MGTPLGDFTHELAGHKSWPTMQPLDFGPFKPASTDVNYAIAGRCGSLKSDGTWAAGVTATTTLLPMPLFLYKGATSFDVSTSASNSHGATVMPTGNLHALVAVGNFELYTTEFDGAVATYAPGKPLKAPTATQTSSSVPQSGVLYNLKNWTGGGGGAVTFGTETIVGICSWGRTQAGAAAPTGANYTGALLNSLLAFWPVYYPGTA